VTQSLLSLHLNIKHGVLRRLALRARSR